jgi:hypothetical protein
MACEDARAFDTVTLNLLIILHSWVGLEKDSASFTILLGVYQVVG